MEPQPNQSPLIVIVGQTGSGKSALAMELAQQFNGEIIAADSRTVYKQLDIGTAKPNLADQHVVPHHALDIVDPDEPFTVANFKHVATTAIQAVASRGKLPFLVGGSGLYIDSILYDFSFRVPADPVVRQQLEQLTVEQLQGIVTQKGLPMPANHRNPRHLIRTIESGGQEAVKNGLRPNTLIIGIDIDRDTLASSLTHRVDAMLQHGLIEEVDRLSQTYGWDTQSLQSTGYKAFRPYLAGVQTLDEAKAQFVRNDLQLAKRQRTWFRRNKSIHWICKKDEAIDLITTFLNKESIAKS